LSKKEKCGQEKRELYKQVKSDKKQVFHDVTVEKSNCANITTSYARACAAVESYKVHKVES